MLLVKSVDRVELEYVAENILKDIREQKIEHMGSSVADHLTISMGMTLYQSTQDISSEQLLKQADIALYHAKKAGRNQSRLYQE